MSWPSLRRAIWTTTLANGYLSTSKATVKSRQPLVPVKVIVELEFHETLKFTGVHLEELSLQSLGFQPRSLRLEEAVLAPHVPS